MSVDHTKRVCVIGAGASGLPSIRHALLYGFDVVCYESQEEIGGLWRYKPEESDESSVMKSTVINSSKELTAYSDFPPPATEANYMHNTHMYGYLKDYADHYGLHAHIQMNTRVLNVERAADYVKSGRWRITTQKKGSSESKTEEFDGVLMCCGHHTTPHWPAPWPGQDTYKGSVIHAHSYKDHKGYEDKVVVVVGVGNSGGDIAVELSKIAKQVYLVSRRGTWVFNHIFDYGRPIDCTRTTRLFESVRMGLPDVISDYLARKLLNRRFDHEAYGLKPSHSVFSAHPTVNDELPNRIACGTVRVKPQISSFTEHGVNFTDGTEVDNVDAAIVSTGYSFNFPMVEGGSLMKVKENEVDLFEYVFPMECDHDTLGVIGFIQPLGSIMPISEMQARVFLDVLSGRTKLPTKAERAERNAVKKAEMDARYVKSRRHTIQVDYVSYMDGLAALIGCEMAMHALIAPLASYFYRLRGPHAWKGARGAILTIEDRIIKATNANMNQSIYSSKNENFGMVCYIVLLTVGLLTLIISTIF